MNRAEAKALAIELIREAKALGVTRFEFAHDDLSVKADFTAPCAPVMNIGAPAGAASAPSSAPADETAQAPAFAGVEVKAPLVGTYYAASNPEAEPYVSVGDKVKKGDIVCIIEAMKNLNEIEAPVSGTVSAIYAQNGQLLEYNQTILTIEEE